MNETIDINPKKQLLTVQNLNLTRGTFQLKDISFSVYSNEILAIIGKTGSGKTLLLESIAGFQKLDSGKDSAAGTFFRRLFFTRTQTWIFISGILSLPTYDRKGKHCLWIENAKASKKGNYQTCRSTR